MKHCRIKFFYTFAPSLTKRHNQGLTRGVIGNTSGFGPEESRFEPWRVNQNKRNSQMWIPFLFDSKFVGDSLK